MNLDPIDLIDLNWLQKRILNNQGLICWNWRSIPYSVIPTTWTQWWPTCKPSWLDWPSESSFPWAAPCRPWLTWTWKGPRGPCNRCWARGRWRCRSWPPCAASAALCSTRGRFRCRHGRPRGTFQPGTNYSNCILCRLLICMTKIL